MLTGLGHDVKLIAPEAVRPFVKKGKKIAPEAVRPFVKKGKKNDAADAAALCAAASRPVKRHVVLRVNATRSFTSPLRKGDDSIPLFDRRAIPSSRPRYGDASRAVAVHDAAQRHRRSRRAASWTAASTSQC
jgi:hypothetical protein